MSKPALVPFYSSLDGAVISVAVKADNGNGCYFGDDMVNCVYKPESAQGILKALRFTTNTLIIRSSGRCINNKVLSDSRVFIGDDYQYVVDANSDGSIKLHLYIWSDCVNSRPFNHHLHYSLINFRLTDYGILYLWISYSRYLI